MFEISINSIVFIEFVTRKRITQTLTTLNVKKFKLKKSNNFETIKTKKNYNKKNYEKKITIQKTSNKIQFKFKKVTKNKKMTKFKKTKKSIKKKTILRLRL